MELVFDHVSVAYGDHPAVRSISLTVRPGEVVALAGPNGSGKSTLIRAAVGLTERIGGTVRVGSCDLRTAPSTERARRVAWMPQDEPVGDNVPLVDYVEYGRYSWIPRWARPGPNDRAQVARALAEVDLTALVGRGIAQLSGGERQRARLARTLAQDAPVILLDEPTAHLDIGHQLDVLERIRSFAHREGRAVLLAVHDLNLAARFADRIAVLSHGRLVATGAPAEVLSPELLEQVWGVVAEIRTDRQSGLPYLLPRLTPPDRDRLAPSPGQFRVHLVAGGGSGSVLLRTLFDRGFDLSVGVVPLFDSDTELARDLGLPVAAELPFAPIGPEAVGRLDLLLEKAGAILVAPFPVGPTNLANLEHLLEWIGRRPLGLLDQPASERWDYTDGRATRVRDELLRRGATPLRDLDAAVAWLGTLGSAAPSR